MKIIQGCVKIMKISYDTIIGVFSTLIGTILGWILNELSNSLGKISIRVSYLNIQPQYREQFVSIDKLDNMDRQKYVGQYIASIHVSCSLIVTNNKKNDSGINGGRICIKNKSNKKWIDYGALDMIGNESELDELLNIKGKTTKKIKIERDIPVCGWDNIQKGEYEVYFKYKVNGERKERKYLIR